MKKRLKDLEKGDIIKVEFGDYGNFVTVVVDEINNDNSKVVGCEIKCHYLSDKQPEIMWGEGNELIEVLGKEQPQ